MRITTPVYPGLTQNERWSSLRFTTTFFHFNQKAYRISFFDGNSLYLQKSDKKPGWFEISLRVVLIFTVIVPMLMLIGSLIYHAANHFEFFQFSALPDELQKQIIQYVDLDLPALSVVNRKINSLVREKEFRKNRMLSKVFYKALETVNLMNDFQAPVYYCQLARFLSTFDRKRAMQMLNLALERKKFPKHKRQIAGVMALWDVEKALLLSKQLNGMLRSHALLMIVVAIADQIDRALEIYNKIEHEPFKAHAYRKIVFEIAKVDVERAERLLPSLDNLTKFEVLATLAASHHPKAREFADQALSMINLWPYRRDILITQLIKAYFAKHDRNKALELAFSIGDRSEAYAYIVNESDLNEVLEWTEPLDPENKCLALSKMIDRHPDLKERVLALAKPRMYFYHDLIAKFDRETALRKVRTLTFSHERAKYLLNVLKYAQKNEAFTIAQRVYEITFLMPPYDERGDVDAIWNHANRERVMVLLSLGKKIRKI